MEVKVNLRLPDTGSVTDVLAPFQEEPLFDSLDSPSSRFLGPGSCRKFSSGSSTAGQQTFNGSKCFSCNMAKVISCQWCKRSPGDKAKLGLGHLKGMAVLAP
ncbi:uncharacterized protein LOC122305216 [Carya illinoinensis]|uniref:uncharacterized protein LOC122305216 n=1 Tax=Carya illinoinensis TaxID=32201 RepID=UPI001C71BF08|nr:uncharacterized protein LOC122305216 [Carya illinoinensis]